MQKRQDGSYTLTETDGAHRGHLLDHHRPLDPDARHDQAQGREGHPGHGSQGAQEARRGLSRPVRTLLLTGPGGAGTSTLAAAAAVRAARAGRRTRAAVPAGRPGRRAWPTSPGLDVVRRRPAGRPSSGSGAARPAPSAPSCPQLTLPPASSVVPLPGTAELALFAELAARRGRPGRRRRRPARGDGRAGRRCRRRCAGGSTSCMPPGMRALGAVRTAAVAAGAAQARAGRRRAGRRPGRRGAAGPRPAGRPRRRVCLVAEPRRGVGRRPLRAAVDDAGPARPARRRASSPGCCRWTARGSGRRGAAAEQDAVLAALAEVAPVHRVPERAVAAGGRRRAGRAARRLRRSPTADRARAARAPSGTRAPGS